MKNLLRFWEMNQRENGANLDLDELMLLVLDLKESPLFITFFPDVAKFLNLYNSLELIVSGKLLPRLLALGTFKKEVGDNCGLSGLISTIPKLPAWEFRLARVRSVGRGNRKCSGSSLIGR